MSLTDFFLIASGLVAGTIDAIAGGGGMITLPVLTEVLEPGAHAIGTNKIVGTTAAAIAFFVYLRKHPLNLKKGLTFVLAVGFGSFLGSLLNPHVPKIYFRYFLLMACPVILWVVWNKRLLIQEVSEHFPHPFSVLLGTGTLVGFYDGFFGPGGGTFMLIGLLWAAKLPLFEALLLSKLANTLSAGVSLISYGIQGYVHVRPGVVLSLGIAVGAYCGAKLASNQAEKIVRPVLLLVVVGLMLVQLKEVVNYH